MKKFQNLGKGLTKEQQKKIIGGDETVGGPGDSCNVICTSDSQCKTTCTKCVKNSNWDNGVCERP